MFGTNQIVGKRHFKDMPANTLKVTSMFFTLQGEGPYGGKPSLFIRLSHCNLACSFCDTLFDQGDVMTFEQIETKYHQIVTEWFTSRGLDPYEWAIDNIAGKDFYNLVLVITGGEPLLQENLNAFLQTQPFRSIQIESNGTVEQVVPYHVTFVCSPKCAEKDGKPTKYLKPSNWMLDRADCLKFVVNADQDSPYSSIPDWAHAWAKATGKEVYVSPMNVYNQVPQKIRLLRAEKDEVTLSERSTVDEVVSFWEPGLLNMEANRRNHEYAAEYAMKYGFRLNLQVHLFASLA